MKSSRAFCLLALTILRCQAASGPSWSTGFWFWQGSHAPSDRAAVDQLYVQAGGIQGDLVQPWAPEKLPAAREYWLVYRFDGRGVPNLITVYSLLAAYQGTAKALQARGGKVAGLQLDIDSPTGSLPQYARYLREVRKALPAGTQLSITALLDWFRPGTAMAEVAAAVDEFVPQFYDAGGVRGLARIAEPVDAARWGPMFEAFGKRYRIGISCFGRALESRKGLPALVEGYGLSPLAAATTAGLERKQETTAAGEVVLRYTARRLVKLGWNGLQPGEALVFSLPTADSVRTAYTSARRMGKHCAGVLFFRWPAEDDGLTITPSAVLRHAGVPGHGESPKVSLDAVGGDCAAVHCMQLTLRNVDSVSATPVRYVIRSSVPLEYFVPEKGAPVRAGSPAVLEVRLPAYPGLTKVQLGTAVTRDAATYQLQEAK